MTGPAAISRRDFVGAVAAGTLGFTLLPRLAEAAPKVLVTGFELLPVRATDRTVWLFVRLRTDAGLTGLGEASDAFGFLNTTKPQAMQMEAELRRFFELVKGKSPLDIGAYHQQGEPLAARGGLVSATAYSAIEQALWDLAGKALDVPTCTLFGGRLRSTIPVYANINRATNPRTPAGFAASAAAAAREEFTGVKGAPWDGFPPKNASASAIESAVRNGIACVAAMRGAIGPDVELMADGHSFFDVPLGERVARELEPFRLAWYEEPVAPERIDDMREIHRRIRQPMAAGELLFGIAGFAPLSTNRSVDVIMPDVKHCGGLSELLRIAAVAERDGVVVAPHNPSGPVSTAANVQVCAVLRNFRLLEYQWGEVEWRHDLVTPAEWFDRGSLHVPDRPGLGIELNDALVRAHMM